MLIIFVLLIANFPVQGNTVDELDIITPDLYEPVIAPLNVKESMTLSPMFTPDNAIDIHVAWIKNAQTSIDVQNQYLTQWDDSVSWANDPSPLVRALVDAHNDGVTVRLQINEDGDSDDITSYFLGLGIEVRWMGNADSTPEIAATSLQSSPYLSASVIIHILLSPFP